MIGLILEYTAKFRVYLRFKTKSNFTLSLYSYIRASNSHINKHINL